MNTNSVGKFCAIAGMLFSSSAFAEQTWAPPAEIAPKAPQAQADPVQPPTMQKPAAEPKIKGKDCRVQADAKGLHGKARKDFRAECEKG